MKLKHISSLLRRGWLTAAISGLLLAVAKPATAQNVIKNPTDHPHYAVELEPHLVLDFIGNDGWGLGGRATFVVMDPGFVTSINNTVAIGVGLDWVDGNNYCIPAGCFNHNHLILPAAMQWNFWFTPHWSAFGEPGLAIFIHDSNNFNNDAYLDFAFYVGGRYNFNQQIALTLRLGVPTSSFGVSFFL